MLHDRRPRGRQRPRVAEHVRRDHGQDGRAVGVDVRHVAAKHPQHALERLGSAVKLARALPAVAATVDRPVAILALDAPQFRRHDVEGLVPRHADKRFDAAARRVAPPAITVEALPDHGRFDAVRRVQDVPHHGDHAVRVGVAGERPRADEPAAGDVRGERAPVRYAEAGHRRRRWCGARLYRAHQWRRSKTPDRHAGIAQQRASCEPVHHACFHLPSRLNRTRPRVRGSTTTSPRPPATGDLAHRPMRRAVARTR